MRQSRGQGLPQLRRFHFLIGGRDNECHHLVNARQRPQHRRRRAHAGLGGQRSGDFIQLDAEATDFHLAVHAA